VPAGTVFQLHIADGRSIGATARWSRDDHMGVEFASALSLDGSGRVDMSVSPAIRRASVEEPLRKAG
jgi:hypothetical protein